jgi:hypothetical protein
VFDQISGLPVHALVVHAAVIFVPLLAVGAIVYALLRRWRPKIGWAVGLLAVIAPVTTLVAKLSGEKLYDRLIAQGLNGGAKDLLDEHMAFAGTTLWWVLALSVVALVLLGLTWRAESKVPRMAEIGLSVLVIVLAALSGYYVFRTGDSGAHAVWGV